MAKVKSVSRAVIYCRISKDDRGDQLGVDRQEHLCRELAATRGYDITAVLVDNDRSAFQRRRPLAGSTRWRDPKRPEFEHLAAMIEAGEVDAIVSYHADRLYRRVTQLEALVELVESHRVQVATVAAGEIDLSTASGRMVARMLAATGQHESERQSERLRAKHDELARKGLPGGRAPYGYDHGHVINDDQAVVVRRIAARVLEGQPQLRIARELNADGIPTKWGKEWHVQNVRQTVLSPAVAGLRVHRGEIAGPGRWEPILDRATWEAVRSVLHDPARRKRRAPAKYLLTGLVESPTGDKLTAHRANGRRAYRTETGATTHVAIDAERLELLVIEVVLQALDTVALPVGEWGPGLDARDLDGVEAEMKELTAAYTAGRIALDQFLAMNAPLMERRNALISEIAPVNAPGPIDHVLAQPGALRACWNDLGFERRRDALRGALDRVVVGKAAGDRKTSDLRRVDVRLRGPRQCREG